MAANPKATTTTTASTMAADSQQRQQDQKDDSSHATTAQRRRLQQQTTTTTAKTLQTLFSSLLGKQQQQTQSGRSDTNEQQHMELSQIELIYRAEGNANLVLALPQFKKVLRLPKMLLPPPSNSSSVQQQQQQQQQKEYCLQQHRQSTSGLLVAQHNTKVPFALDLTMVDFAAYIAIIRRLLGNEFVFETDIVEIPTAADRNWINEHIRQSRPAHRLAKEFCGQFGLLLPDATQLPASFDVLLSNLQPEATSTGEVGDAFAIEIKPKQGWLLPSDVNDLFDMKPTTTATAATTTPTKMAKTDTRCRYCAMQFLKLANRKISKRSSYCPIELFSGTPSRMLAALQALLECPQNNLRIFRNGNLIYGDHSESISWKDLNERVFHEDTLQLIKHLVVTCLLRDYTDAAADAGNVAADVVVVAAETVVGQPHSSATPTELSRQTTATVTAPPDAATETEVQAAQATTTTTLTQTQAQINEAEVLCLPKNCVLQKVLHLQLLAKRQLYFMSAAGYATKSAKSYNALAALRKTADDAISFGKLQPLEEYLLGATALDCSIMLAFREVSAKCAAQSPHVVHLPAYKRSFLTKVTLVDLDPKPDSHFSKYVKQTREAYTEQQKCALNSQVNTFK